MRKKTLVDYFENLEDPRIERGKRHSLLNIVTIAICAVICGADSWVYVEMFGKSKEEWFRTFLELPNGIPSHDTPALAGAGFWRCVLPVGPGPVPGVLHGMEPGGGETVARGGGSH